MKEQKKKIGLFLCSKCIAQYMGLEMFLLLLLLLLGTRV